MEWQVSRLAKFGLGKLKDLSNLDIESHAMIVTCIIKLIILQIEHNIFHISYHIIHIILSYALRTTDHGLALGIRKMRAKHIGPQLWNLL